MQNVFLNKKGASLLEVVATITIISISILFIFNILSFNIRQNAISQERTINANISNAALNYIKNQSFEDFKTFLDNSNLGHYAIINEKSCDNNNLFENDVNICNNTLSPTINNKTYNSLNFNIYLLPYNDYLKLSELRDTPPDVFPPVLNKYIENIDMTVNNEKINDDVIRVIVIVDSNIGENYDYLLEGVITNDK